MPGGLGSSRHILDTYLHLDQPDNGVMAEYVWIDGTGQGLRSKCRTLYEEPQKPEGNVDWWNTLPAAHSLVLCVNCVLF